VKYQLQWTFAKRSIASKPLVLQLNSILSLLKPMETINLKEEVRSLIDQLPENFTWSDLISAIYLRQAMKSEPIQVKSIKQGKNIQLSETFNIPDGSEVLIEVREVSPVNPEDKLKRRKEFLTAWLDEDREEWQKIGEFLESDYEEQLKRMKELLAALSDEYREEWQKISREWLESDRTTNRKSSVMPPKKRRAPLFGSDRDLISISDGFDEPLEDFKDYM
jgi:hypothetical protein